MSTFEATTQQRVKTSIMGSREIIRLDSDGAVGGGTVRHKKH